MGKIKKKMGVKQEADGDLSQLWLYYKPRSTTLIRFGSDWISQLAPEEGEANDTDGNTKRQLKELAGQLHHNDTANYNKREESGSKGKDIRFRKTVYSHGTSRDKVAAHVLRCMETPVHSLSNLNALVAMVTPKAKGRYQEVFNALIEILDSAFLPHGHIPRRFESHNFSCLTQLMASGRELAEKQLLLWYFEDQLICAYQRLVKQLIQVCQDAVEKTKLQGVRCLVELVQNRPDLDIDSLALGAVVNKLGDPSRKVATSTVFQLRTLIQRRQQLKYKVVDHIQDMLYRFKVGGKAQYFCLCFLKDMIFSHEDSKLPNKLIKLYFGFFKACIKQGEVETRMMGAILRGINRAFPYTRMSGRELEEQIDTLYKLSHFVNFATATQALQLIYQVTGSMDQVTDRFYQVVYRRLQDSAFGTSTATSAFLNLVFKALMRDETVPRIQAFIKRLLQVSVYMNPHVVTGVLYLVSEIAKEKPLLATETLRLLQTNAEKGGDDSDSLEVFSDVDNEHDDVAGKDGVTPEAKQITKVASRCNSNRLQGSLDGASIPLSQNHPTSSIKVKPSTNNFPTATSSDIKPPLDIKPAVSGSSWVHLRNMSTCRLTQYDPYHRNPLYAGAQFSPLWELKHLKAHYHPSVALFAGDVMKGKGVHYSGDPLQDFTLIKFLDRFICRNPKQATAINSACSSVFNPKSQYTPKGVRAILVNSAEFTALDPENVPVDDVFFHRYFTNYKMVKKDDDDVSVDDDEFDAYLNRMNRVRGQDDEDGDFDFASGAKPAKSNSGDDVDMDQDDDEEVDGDDWEEEEGDDWEDKEDGDWVDEDGDLWEDEDGDDMGGFGSDEFDEEAEFSDDDDDFKMDVPKKKSKGLVAPAKNKKMGRDSLSSMFANAEDFDHLLEENADEAMNPITTQSVSNRDRAPAKQIHWEIDRNNKMKNQPWRQNKMKDQPWRNNKRKDQPWRNNKRKDQPWHNKQNRGRPGANKDPVRKMNNKVQFKAKKSVQNFKKGKQY